MSAADLFNSFRAFKREQTGDAAVPLTQSDVDAINAFLKTLGWSERQPAVQPFSGELTPRIVMEIICHEAIVPEAYKDSVGVWTWGVGVTNASGHLVHPRYKDNPQTLERCLEVFIWLLREKYAPSVVKAFAGHSLTEAQFAAALSFHYNTGSIGKASWVNLWKSGDEGGSHRSFIAWNKPPEILPRRNRERDLFFDGRWCADGKAMVYPVRKPSYTPYWAQGQRVDVSGIIEALLT